MMSKADRTLMIVRSMTSDERAEFFHRLDCDYCLPCGEELPDEDSDEQHDCPFALCICLHEAQEHDPDDPHGRCLAKEEDGSHCPCAEFKEEDDEEPIPPELRPS